MAENLKPQSDEQARDAVAWAVSEKAPLEIAGRGSKRALGRPMQTAHTLDLSAFSGIDLYEPEELILRAGAATPLAEVEAALAEKHQELAFEPADLGPLLGGEPGQATLGGVLACNLSGPRRIKAGAARDHFLGYEGVSGRGELYKSGGRVMKNVTGYDLCKLMAGAYGTLSAMLQVTVKVLPASEKTRTVLVVGADEATALAAMTRALMSEHEVSAAAHLPAALAARSQAGYVKDAGGAVTALRIEGTPISVEHRTRDLRAALSAFGETEELHGHNSAVFWKEVRDAAPFVATPKTLVWRISVAPQSGPAVAGALSQAIAGAEAYYDWGGGLIWLSAPEAADGHHETLREAVRAAGGGHATLIRAPEAVRGAVPVFQPQPDGLRQLTERVKDGFDPNRVLNPGRMHAGV
jgi:glycolate oxidase FAD binding subunit